MNMTADVIIVGGAVMGSSIAYWLTRMQPGLEVLVLERDPSYAQASTALSVASIRQQFTTAVNVRISRFGIEFIRNFAENLQGRGEVPSLGLQENGYLFLSSTADGAAALADVAAMQRAEGAVTELWSGDLQLKARFPGWKPAT
ncbi:MAG: FAD-dependent oxidoreductase [Paracoccaceae bacterium]